VDGWELRVRRYASETMTGQVVYRPAAPWLSGYVLGYSGWQVKMTQPARRRLLPFGGVSVLLDFVSPDRRDADDGTSRSFRMPVAGMQDGPVVFSQSGSHFGVGVGLTPAGARALFGAPMHELTNTVAELGDLMGSQAERLAGRLAEAPDWSARFGLLDNTLPNWMETGPRPLDAVDHAWRRLGQSSGRLTVAALADDAGCSVRYLEKRFQEQIGVSPKTAAQILRFQRVLHLAAGPSRPELARVATMCGYVDQAHLNRDFRRFAGCAPMELLAG
jgi:AraC-like DNA-binding protein